MNNTRVDLYTAAELYGYVGMVAFIRRWLG